MYAGCVVVWYAGPNVSPEAWDRKLVDGNTAQAGLLEILNQTPNIIVKQATANEDAKYRNIWSTQKLDAANPIVRKAIIEPNHIVETAALQRAREKSRRGVLKPKKYVRR